jgi:hypothetical protein
MDRSKPMPIPKSFASALVLAGALTCGAPSNPSDAAERVRPGNPWQQAFDVDEEPLTRDLRPMPAKPSHTAPHPRVTLRPSSPVVTVGEPISFEVGSNMNGFGHIYVLSASGRVQVWMENVPVAAGQRLQFPTGRVWIRAAAPDGRDDFMLIFSKFRIVVFCVQ